MCVGSRRKQVNGSDEQTEAFRIAVRICRMGLQIKAVEFVVKNVESCFASDTRGGDAQHGAFVSYLVCVSAPPVGGNCELQHLRQRSEVKQIGRGK